MDTPSSRARLAVTVWAVVAVAAAVPMSRRLLAPGFVPWLGPWLLPALFVALPSLHVLRAYASWGPELGLARPSARGVAVMSVGSLAMPLVFLAEGARPASPDVDTFVRGVVVAPVVEELLMRGYAFRQLHLRAGWSRLAALASTAVVFGVLHIPTALDAGEGGNVLGTVLVTAAGGAWYAWLLARWSFSLWVPIAMHATMNLWWTLFSVGPTAGAGGSAAAWARGAAIALVTFGTVRLAPPAPAQPTAT